MTITKWEMVAYALAMLGLGAYGSIKKGEPMSLMGSAVICVIVLLMVWWSFRQPRWAYIITLLVAAATAAKFFSKTVENGVFSPVGLISPLSILMCVGLLLGHLLAKKPSTPAAGTEG